jgi:subtilase family serine protease
MFVNWYKKSVAPHPVKVTGTRRAPKAHAVRSYRPEVEVLEDRLALSNVELYSPAIALPDQSSAPPPGAFTPAELRQAYGINQVSFDGITGDGAGQTIAIIDAGDNPKFVSSTDPGFDASDLHQFDLAFGLPDPPSFIKLNQEGQQGNYPPANIVGFAAEEALDVEWTHAIAPAASIILIETNDNFSNNLIVAGVSLARSLPQVSVVSMSFGFNEVSDETSFDSLFTTPAGHRGITFLASTGDTGSYPNQSTVRPEGYPALSPNVVAVGGTTLTVGPGGDYESETGWSGSGGGLSQFEPQPAYQKGTVTQSSTQRAAPDVSFDADPDTGVALYDSFDNGNATPWNQEGGTSLACPCWAAIVAIADQERALVGESSLDGATQTLPTIYKLPQSDFHDITSGSNGMYSAGPGYDLVTGRGTPIAQLLIPALAGVDLTNFTRAYHPFRYIVGATLPATASDRQGGTVDTGNLTAVNYLTQSVVGVQLIIVLGPLPAGVTLASSVPTVATSTGQLAIPLPVTDLPNNEPVRVQIILDNPKNVSLSTFFEGFSLELEPVLTTS